MATSAGGAVRQAPLAGAERWLPSGHGVLSPVPQHLQPGAFAHIHTCGPLGQGVCSPSSPSLKRVSFTEDTSLSFAIRELGVL